MNALGDKATSDMALVGFVLGGLLLLVIGGFIYSFGWSERFLAPVHVDMSKGQVQSLIGSPLQIHTNDGYEIWSYTRSWSRDANVHFGTNGFVLHVETD